MNKKKSSFGGGLVVLLIGIMLLWWNEGNNVRNLQSVSEGIKNYTDVKSNKIDSKYDGKLVATSGKITFEVPASDSEFGVTSNSAVLKRTVEMYQWQEECETDDNDNKNCTYKKLWSEDIIDSSEFEKSGHDNPTSMLYDSEKFYGYNVKLGAFEMTSNLLEKLSTKNQVKSLSEEVATSHGMSIDKVYYTNVSEEEPEIGNLRISFYKNDSQYVSVLAMQSDNHFKVYKTKKGKDFFNLYEEEYNGADMFQIISKQNNFGKWLLRIVGILCVIMGIGSLFNPIENLAKKVPILGNIVGAATGTVSFVLGLAISLLVIAIAWFRFRPVLSIILIAVIIGLILFLKMNGKEKAREEVKQSSNDSTKE